MPLERKMFVEAVAAEVAHEIMAGTNYFRMLVERSLRGQNPESEDWQIAGQELDRLEELLRGLKRLAAHRLSRAPVSLGELVAPLQGPPWEKLAVAVDPGVRIVCDAPRLGVALRALVENALAAAAPDGAVGIEWRFEQRAPRLCVWDAGPPRRAAALFESGSEVGHLELALTVARRTIRAHGWTLEIGREKARTCAAIQLRPEDVVP